MIIDDNTIENIQILSKLELNEDEKIKAKQDIGNILELMEKLNQIDTKDTEPLVYNYPSTNVFREDVITNNRGQEALLKNAPSSELGSIIVPKTVE